MAIYVKIVNNPTGMGGHFNLSIAFHGVIVHASHPELQMKQAVAIALAAFEGDPCIDDMIGGDQALRESLFRAIVGAGAVEGSFFTASGSDHSDNIMSIGIWFQPGKVMMDSEAQQHAGWKEFYAAMTPAAQDWWMKEFYPRHNEAMTACMGPNSAKNSWFANLIATHPYHQKQGYGSAIVRKVCQLAAAEGAMVALATQNESNVSWYEKLGFKVKDRLQFGTKEAPWSDFLLCYDSRDVSRS